MELAKINRSLPIKAIPEQELNRIILGEFTVWVANLLSLTDETSANRLEIALPAIKDHCWSMGFDEVKKMFEMYVDNKLGIQPIPNYFDRILFGKIAAAYKSQRPAKKKELAIPEIGEAEKMLLINQGIIRTYNEFKEKSDVGTGTAWVYDHLDVIGAFNFSKDEKWNAMRMAKVLEKSEVDQSKAGAKNILEMIEQKGSTRVVNRAKRIMLNDYFKITKKQTLTDKLNAAQV